MKQILALTITALLLCGLLAPAVQAVEPITPEETGASDTIFNPDIQSVSSSAITLTSFEEPDRIDAVAFALGTSQEELSNWFYDVTAGFIGYDADGTPYDLISGAWSLDAVNTGTTGVFYASATPDLGTEYTVADGVSLPRQLCAISIQTPGEPDINCCVSGRGFLHFPWILSEGQQNQLDEFTVWLKQDNGEWMQQTGGFIITSDDFQLSQRLLVYESVYELKVTYPGGQTGILSFQYDGGLSIIDYSVGDRDGGDVDGISGASGTQPAPAPSQVPSDPDQNSNLGSNGSAPSLGSSSPESNEVTPAPGDTPQESQVLPSISTTPQNSQVLPSISTTPQDSQVLPSISTTPQDSQLLPSISTTPQSSQMLPSISITTQRSQALPSISNAPWNGQYIPSGITQSAPAVSSANEFSDNTIAQGAENSSTESESYIVPFENNSHIAQSPVSNNTSTTLSLAPDSTGKIQNFISGNTYPVQNSLSDSTSTEQNSLSSSPTAGQKFIPGSNDERSENRYDLQAPTIVTESYSPLETIISGMRLGDLCEDEESVVFGSGDLTISIPSDMLVALNLSASDTLNVSLSQPETSQILLAVEAAQTVITEVPGAVLRLRYTPQSEDMDIIVRNELGEQITEAVFDGQLIRFPAATTGIYTIEEIPKPQEEQKGMAPLLAVSGGLLLAAGGIPFAWRKSHG